MNRLKQERIKKGYTQEGIARNLNITTRHYQRIENKESVPNVYLAIEISNLLKTNIKLLFQIPK